MSCLRVVFSFAALSLLAAARAQVPDLYDPETVRDVWLSFAQPDWWQQLRDNKATKTDIAGDMTVDGATLHDVGVRFRGNTSYLLLPPGSQKCSFDIETDWRVRHQDLYGHHHLNLNNGWHDPTFLREFLSYWIMRRHGLAPQCNFVRLHVNGVYWGLYINVEQPNRDMMQRWFRSNDGSRYRGFPTSGGFSNGRTALTWLGADVGSYLAAYQAKRGDGLDLRQLCDVLNNTPAGQLQSALPPVFDVDTFCRYAAVMNVETNLDSYLEAGKEHCLYRDEVHGCFHVFPFDCNESLAGSAALDPWAFTTLATRPAFTQTLQFPDWRRRYVAHLRSVLEESFDPAFLVPVIQHFHALIAPDVIADGKKLYTTADFLTNLTAPVTIESGYGPVTLPGLVPFVQARAAFLRTHADLAAPRATLTDLQHAPARPDPTQQVVVTVRASALAAGVALYARAQGPFQRTPMADDGLHGDGAAGDGVFGAILPAHAAGALVDYYAEAVTAGGVATYLPSTAELHAGQYLVAWPQAPSPVCINEFLAQNGHGITDAAGQHEDWIELYNTSSQPVDVGGMGLSDDLTRIKYHFPAGTLLPGHGMVLVWCDENGAQGPLHANFKLAGGGEAVALFGADGHSIVDWFEYGPQLADVSTGRARDGGGPWVTFRTPTPGAANEPGPCSVRAYGAQDPRWNTAVLQLAAAPKPGSAPRLTLAGGPAGGMALFALALAPGHLVLAPFGIADEALLLDPVSLAPGTMHLLDDAGAGSTPLPIPADPGLAGLELFAQELLLGGGCDASNGLAIVVCR